MAQKTYTVGGHTFRTQTEYANALRDQQNIEKLRAQYKRMTKADQARLRTALKSGRYRFLTALGEDFIEELEAEAGGQSVRSHEARSSRASTSLNSPVKRTRGNEEKKAASQDAAMDAIVAEELKKQEKRRKWIVLGCSVVGLACMVYLGVYSFYVARTENTYEQMSERKEAAALDAANGANGESSKVVIHYTTDDTDTPEVLDEYKTLLNTNKKLIGWVKIDDTNIDYPVMQTDDNEYYLTHNLNQEYDKNGTIFMDKDCDVLKPSTNLILYGHHMKSGKMFGQLSKYEDESFYEKHKTISFDSIYEKGSYEVMYVFRSRVYSEEEIVFKYYQFIDAESQTQFDSYMNEMASMSLYDTGVTAEYGDRLLTLSTCDYEEKNGRFVVVAKRIEE